MESDGTRVLGHGVGQDLGVGAVNGIDIGLVAGAGGRERFTGQRLTGHGRGLANRIRHQGSRGCESRGPDKRQKLQAGARGGMREFKLRTSQRPRPLPTGRWTMSQRWNDLLFAHWRVPAAVDGAVSCRRDCSRTRFRARHGLGLFRFGWIASTFAACHRCPERAVFPSCTFAPMFTISSPTRRESTTSQWISAACWQPRRYGSSSACHATGLRCG